MKSTIGKTVWLLARATFCAAFLLSFALSSLPFRGEAHAMPPEKVLEPLMAEGEKAADKGNMLEAIKLFIKARQIADDRDSHDYQCLARYNIGVCYFFMSEHGEALHNFYEAYKLCKDYKLGWNRETRIINGIAGVYFEQEDYRRAYDFVKPCYSEAMRMKDTASLRTFTAAMALVSNKLGRFGDSRRYIAEAKRFTEAATPDYAHILAIEAETMFLQRLYPQAEECCRNVLSVKNAAEADRSISLVYLINIYTARHDYVRAFDYSEEARRTSSMRNLPYYFSTMSDLYRQSGDFASALRCKDSVIIFTDSLTKTANRQLLENVRTKLEVLRFTSDMEQEMAKIRHRHYIVLMLLCISVLLMVIAFIAVRNQKAKVRQQSKIMELQIEKRERERQMAEERMKAVEMEARYRQEMMKQSLEQKQRELCATTMFVSSRNELIEDLLNYLNDDTDTKSLPAVKTMTQHLRHLLHESGEKDNFLVNFEAANPGFMQRLQSLHPELLPSDLRFLAYVRMNMQTKEIASLLNINPESCRRRKIRLSKKLGLDSSAELYNYIIGMQ